MLLFYYSRLRPKYINIYSACNCHNHSDKCHFDPVVYKANNETSGGVCDECQHNTEGTRCERCIEGFYHDQSKDLTDPDMCVPCDCDPDGSLNGGICDREQHPDFGMVAGKCHCKANVTGARCDQCKPGYHSLSSDNPLGCTKCDCDEKGTRSDVDSPCDSLNGQCTCKRNVQGARCDMCIPGTYGLSQADQDGCKPCSCDLGGSKSSECNSNNGKSLFLFTSGRRLNGGRLFYLNFDTFC